jgi:V-type H+-transporting ATPase subunit H
MISQEDYSFIVALDNAADGASRERLLKDQRAQCAKTFLSLLGHVSKDQTIQYILVMLDDMLQVFSIFQKISKTDRTSYLNQEDRSRVEIFREHAARKRESMWSPFLNLLNRPDGFIVNMTSRIIAKLACWGSEPMERSDLHFYLTWLKDQLHSQACCLII